MSDGTDQRLSSQLSITVSFQVCTAGEVRSHLNLWSIKANTHIPLTKIHIFTAVQNDVKSFAGLSMRIRNGRRGKMLHVGAAEVVAHKYTVYSIQSRTAKLCHILHHSPQTYHYNRREDRQDQVVHIQPEPMTSK